jgi:hypothetical protein
MFMNAKTYSVVVREVAKEQMWKLMADVDRWKQWDPTVEYSKLDGAFATGSYFTLKPVKAPRVKIRLADVRAPGYFKDETRFPFATMTGEHWYEDAAEGLKVTITMTITGPLSWLWNKIVMSDIVASLPDDVARQVAAAKNIVS